MPAHADTFGLRPIMRVIEGFAAALRAHPLPDQAVLLALGLAHLTLHYKDHTPNGCSLAKAVGFEQSTPVLRRLVGPVASNGAKAYKVGVAALAGTNLFRLMRLSPDARVVIWAYQLDVLDDLFDPLANYGLADVRLARNLVRALPIHLRLQIAIAWRMREPAFALSVAEVGRIQSVVGPVTWERLSRPFIEALRVACADAGAAALLRLEGEPGTRRVDRLVVQVLHGGSLWRSARLIRPSPEIKSLVFVHAGGAARFAADGLRGPALAAVMAQHQRAER